MTVVLIVAGATRAPLRYVADLLMHGRVPFPPAPPVPAPVPVVPAISPEPLTVSVPLVPAPAVVAPVAAAPAAPVPPVVETAEAPVYILNVRSMASPAAVLPTA